MTELSWGTVPGTQTAGWQMAHTNVFGAGLDATYDADMSNQTEGSLFFHLSDWLGTRRQQTDYAGNPMLNFTGLPYGDGVTTIPVSTAAAGDATEQHFTGKERDAESGNDYFGARYYASSMGRFMSPDWSAKVEPVPYSKLDNPQSLNLYAYVMNNPLGRVDASGHAPLSWGGFEDCGDRGDCSGGGQNAAEQAANEKSKAEADGAVSEAKKQSSGRGPGFWGRLGQRLNNFFHFDGFVTNAELDRVHGAFSSFYIEPDSVQEIEPNSYVTMGLDAAGIGATLSGHAYVAGGIAAGSSVYNPDPMNLGLNGMSVVPGILGEAAMPLTVVSDVGSLSGGVVSNNIFAPMIMSIPGNTMDDGNGNSVQTPEAYCVASGTC
jgi:RHS repeat-associated protein